MTPVQRTLASDVLAFDLGAEMRIIHEELGDTHARIARTLVKEGPLRLTLVGLNPGGALRSHEAEGPVTIHVLEGEILLDAGGKTRSLAAGALTALDGGVRHAVSSPQGGIFLLTIAVPGNASRPDRAPGAAGGAV
jgi:quercetin dioxygenase-like cupin family protein